MKKICNICNQEFASHASYANHVRWKHKMDKQSSEIFSSKISSSLLKYFSNKKGKKILIEKQCKTCSKKFTYETFENKVIEKKYCSRSCANSRKIIFTSEMKSKISRSVSATMKEKWEKGEMKVNDKFSSKEERRILGYLKNKFPSDEWTSGGGLKISDEIISRDAYSNKLKICIEYDGIWHFKDIHGQLSLKKLKDFLLNEWCKNNGWKIIRISESWWIENDKNLEILETLMKLNSTEVFMGKEYKS